MRWGVGPIDACGGVSSRVTATGTDRRVRRTGSTRQASGAQRKAPRSRRGGKLKKNTRGSVGNLCVVERLAHLLFGGAVREDCAPRTHGGAVSCGSVDSMGSAGEDDQVDGRREYPPRGWFCRDESAGAPPAGDEVDGRRDNFRLQGLLPKLLDRKKSIANPGERRCFLK